jgi:uncharacterized protein (AIM24 family)
MDLNDLGGELFCQKDAFLAAALGAEVSLAFNKRLGVGFFGGEGFILQKLRGDGMCFIHIGGTVVEKQLTGETLRVDTGCLAAFTSGIDYNIERAGNLKSMFFGGEGFFWPHSVVMAGCGSRVCLSHAWPTGLLPVHPRWAGRTWGRARSSENWATCYRTSR